MEFWQKVALCLKAKQPPVDFGCIMSYGGTIELMGGCNELFSRYFVYELSRQQR